MKSGFASLPASYCRSRGDCYKGNRNARLRESCACPEGRSQGSSGRRIFKVLSKSTGDGCFPSYQPPWIHSVLEWTRTHILLLLFCETWELSQTAKRCWHWQTPRPRRIGRTRAAYDKQ